MPRKHKLACRVSDEYLRDLLDYIPRAKSLPERDKLAISVGIATHLNAIS